MSGVVLLNALGRPEPSPSVAQRLRAIHPGLFLRYVDSFGEHWAVCMGWEPQDDRWEQIQSGDVSPDRAFDIIGYLPMLCSADEAPSYLERMFRTFPRESVQQLSNAMSTWDTTALNSAIESALGEVLDRPNPAAV